jgi:hypothetical protein
LYQFPFTGIARAAESLIERAERPLLRSLLNNIIAVFRVL